MRVIGILNREWRSVIVQKTKFEMTPEEGVLEVQADKSVHLNRTKKPGLQPDKFVRLVLSIIRRVKTTRRLRLRLFLLLDVFWRFGLCRIPDGCCSS